MSTVKLDIVSAERLVFSEDVEAVIAPGVEGQLGILPHHAPLMTMLSPGQLWVRKEGTELCLAISGGFLEVRPDRVIILADTAERSEEIDVARAEEAKRRAEERLAQAALGTDLAQAEASLRRALTRLQAVEKSRRRRRGTQRAG